MEHVYLGTIALEKNRWVKGKIPSLLVSEYVDRAKEDGYAGIELWENHFTLADEKDKCRLRESGIDFIFNSYLTLKNGLTDNLRRTADMICQLNASAVKYNFSIARDDKKVNRDTMKKETETLLRFAELLPQKVRFLCECHNGTLGGVPQYMAEVFENLDSRFGAIIHLVTPLEMARECFDCYGNRICHIHSGYEAEPRVFMPLEEVNTDVEKYLAYYRSRGFVGTVTVEFVNMIRVIEV